MDSHSYLGATLINQAAGLSGSAYISRCFGNLVRLYGLLGFKPRIGYSHKSLTRRLFAATVDLAGLLTRQIASAPRLRDILLLPCIGDKSVLFSLVDMNDYPVKTPQQLGSVLQGYRRERGLTQKAVGDKVGMAQKAVSKIELAPERAGVSLIFKLLAALDLELVVRPKGTPDRRSEW